ncbi:hypothetical protein FG386_000412 [Cryptosporidium ryanae]|uniref:uncharacterized protein n=1 Tax=Cryptosporidium ryanae TaxID=515981 RepID=UPI00351A4059|nr:hypothetical protein FG386_000412 [Cryptosporidium ryanae]
MDIGKYFSGFFTHSLTRSVNENQNSFEDRESYFLLVLKRNSEGEGIHQIIKESEEFNIYELKDLKNSLNLIYLVISLKFTNEKVSVKAEELQPNRENNLFWGDWPPSYSWVFFLGNILFSKVKESPLWEDNLDDIIALHNGESLFDIFEKSTKFFCRNGILYEQKRELGDYSSLKVNEANRYSSIPRLFNIICEWCDYFGPNVMTTFWLLIVNFVITVFIFFINIFIKVSSISVSLLPVDKTLLNLSIYSKCLTPYLILFVPVISSTGLVFLKSILDDFPLPKHKQEDLIYLSSNNWRKKNKNRLELFSLIHPIWSSLIVILISIFIGSYSKIACDIFFQLMIHIFTSLIIIQVLSIIEININVTRESYETLWSLKLPLIIKNLLLFLYWIFVKRISLYFNKNAFDYFPFALTFIVLVKNITYVSFSIPFSKKTIGFKLGPKEEVKKVPLGDYIKCFKKNVDNKNNLIRGFWTDLFFINKSTLYEDLWYYNLVNMVLLAISAEYYILSPLLSIINTFIIIILMFSKILTDSTRPWLLNITLSHQLWKFVFDTSTLFSISFFSTTPITSNLKTFLFLTTFTLNNINYISSKSGKIVYLSESLVFYIFKIVPLFKYTKQVIVKNKGSLNKAINKVLRKRTGLLNNKADIFSDYPLQKSMEVNSNKPIELPGHLQELLEKFEGYWVLLRSNSDSLQEINAALGVSWFIRRAVDKLNPIVHYDIDKTKGIVSISTTLIMGLNDRTTLIITKTKMLGKSNFEEIEKARIEELRNEDFNDSLQNMHDENESNKQFSNKRKKSLDKFLVIDQPSTTFEWSDDKTNIILETRQNREGFKMIETRSIIPSYKLPFKIKGNDGKLIDSKKKEVLCHKVILIGNKNKSINKSNPLVCCRYFVRTEIKIPDSKLSCSRQITRDSNNLFEDEKFVNDSQDEGLNPNFLGETNEFPASVDEITQREDEILSLVLRKRSELLEKTKKLVKEIDGGSQEWTLERSYNGMKVYKKEINKQPFMSCGVTSILLSNENSELELDINGDKIRSIGDIVDYIWDSNNKMYYDPMVEKSDPMHYFRNDENICIFYQAFKGQWGVSGRDFVVICYRYKPDIQKSSYLDDSNYEYILTQSVEWPTINSTYVRAKNYFATYVFRPITENKVQALYFNQVDLHTDISAWIIKRVILDQMNSLTMLRDILQKKNDV